MIKVYLTSDCTTPPLTFKYECDRVKYYKIQHRLSMYKKARSGREKLYRYAIIDEWSHVKYIDETGKEIIIK